MKIFAFAFFSCAVLAGPACGQELISLTRLPSAAVLSLNQSDRSLLAKSDSDRKAIGVYLQNIPLAYDTQGKNLMAQWRSVYTTAAGQSFQYQALVGKSGNIHFVISSKF